ncbi:MAG TPA: sigma factor, partial [Candidatus Polarisedimenticolia bacterium]|nr:sigma factor [Candidatus Polarisedimenticolia bacterium]
MDRTADAALTDEELIRRFRGGDQAAFDALVHKHQKEIYRIAYRITGNHAEADDLAQETFCRAYTALAGFRQEASFR